MTSPLQQLSCHRPYIAFVDFSMHLYGEIWNRTFSERNNSCCPTVQSVTIPENPLQSDPSSLLFRVIFKCNSHLITINASSCLKKERRLTNKRICVWYERNRVLNVPEKSTFEKCSNLQWDRRPKVIPQYRSKFNEYFNQFSRRLCHRIQ